MISSKKSSVKKSVSKKSVSPKKFTFKELNNIKLYNSLSKKDKKDFEKQLFTKTGKWISVATLAAGTALAGNELYKYYKLKKEQQNPMSKEAQELRDYYLKQQKNKHVNY